MGWLASTKEFFKKMRGEEESSGPKFTLRAQQVFALARDEAERLHHNYIGTEHVLLGLIKLGTGGAYNVLVKLDSTENVCKEVERLAPPAPNEKMIGSIPLTPRVMKALDLAREEARALRHTNVDTEHLLLGLLREGDGLAVQVLRNCGMDLDRLSVAILKELNPNYTSDDESYSRHFARIEEARIEQVTKLQNPPEDTSVELTPRAQQVLVLARKEADRLNHNYFGTEHLLVGLIELGTGVSAALLVKKGVTLEKVRAELDRIRGPDQRMFGNIPYTPRMKRVIQRARREASALSHTYAGTEHLLLGLLHEDGLLREDGGAAARLFKKFGVDMETLHQEILNELTGSQGQPPQ